MIASGIVRRGWGKVRHTIAAAAVVVASAAGLGTAEAKPVEYAKICSLYGAGWFYIPGTDTCINTSTGETRVQTELGTKVDQSELAGRVSETEGGIEETQSEIDATNAELAKTNKQLNQQTEADRRSSGVAVESGGAVRQRLRSVAGRHCHRYGSGRSRPRR